MTKRKNIKYNIYILEASDGTYYTGLTKNLKRRLELHNSGRGAKYLKGRLPVKLVYCERKSDLKTAMVREREIKKYSHRRKEKIVNETKGFGKMKAR